MTPVFALEKLQIRDERAVITQLTPGPVLIGSPELDGSLSYTCGWCETMVLCQDINPGQIYDVVFRCHGCGALSASERLAPGRPWPIPILVLYKDVRVSTLRIEQTRGTIIGITEMRLDHQTEGRLRKLSMTLPGARLEAVVARRNDTSRSMAPNATLTPEVLQNLVERVKEVIGADLFDRLWAQHARGCASNTPPARPHGLMELVARVRESTDSLGQSQPACDMMAVGELLLAVTLFEAWCDDAAWPAMAKSFEEPSNFCHDLHLLAAASSLFVQGYDVRIHREEGPRAPRAADLRVVLSWRDGIIAELKTPNKLQHIRDKDLGKEECYRLVSKALKAAGSGAGGQLEVMLEERPRCSAALIIGAMNLGMHDLELLCSTASEILTKTGRSRAGLCAIVFSAINTICDVVVVDGTILAKGGGSIGPQTFLRTIPNPFCDSAILLMRGQADLSSHLAEGQAIFVSPPPVSAKW